MTKIKSLADLQNKKEDLQSKLSLIEKVDGPGALIQIKVGMATSGIASGAKEVMDFLTEAVEKRNIPAIVTQVGDMGYCYAEPTVEIKKPGETPVVFGYVDITKADQIIEQYIKQDELLEGVIPVNYLTVDDDQLK